MASIHIPKEIAQEIVYENGGEYTINGKEYNFHTVLYEITDTTRWSIHRFTVFKDINSGRFYGVNYSEGATEFQDESPFEYDGDMIEFHEYEPYEKMVIAYDLVED